MESINRGDFHLANATDTDGSGSGLRQIDQAAMHIRTAIIDLHHNRLVVREVGHPNMGVQWQGFVRRGHRVAVETFSGGGLATIEAGPIPGCLANGLIRHGLAAGDESYKEG